MHSTQFSNFNPIGIAHSCYAEKFGTPRQPGLTTTSSAFIEVHSVFQPELSLQGLADYSHVWLIFLFHLNKNERFHAKVHPPRLNGKTMGLFATRTPHRPNPIGLSLVTLEKVEKNGIWVRGIDIVEETPILDIKPYLPEVESIPEAKSGWLSELPCKNPTVVWMPDALASLNQSTKDEHHLELKKLIEDTVKLDPRPLVYKADDESESKYRDSHVLRISKLDIEFKFVNKDEVRILGVRLV